MERRGPIRRLHVALVMGGQSAERDVSLASARTVQDELSREHRVRGVEILRDGRWRIEGGEPCAPAEAVHWLHDEGVDVVFNALHGPLGEDGSVQGLCRILQLPLTGPDVIAAAVTMDKRFTKQVLLAEGIRTPRWFSLSASRGPEDDAAWLDLLLKEATKLPPPWVLKPNRLGSSVGIFLIDDAADLARETPRIRRALEADDLLVEEKINGRELSCPVVELGGTPRALPAIEIRPRSSRFFDYEAKYTAGATEEICPAPLSPGEREAVEAAALEVHRLLGCEPLSRTDMFLTPYGELEILETNTLPGLTKTSLVPLAASQAGLALGDLFTALLEHAIERAQLQGYGPSRSAGVEGKSIVEQL